MKILMVLTAHDKFGNTGHKTGFWLEAQLYGDNVIRDYRQA